MPERPSSALPLARLTLALAVLLPAAPAQLRLSRAFSDHMVLQREQPCRIWGWGTPGAKVTVAFGGQQVATTVGPDGAFVVELAPMPASATPRELTVEAGEKLHLRDVLVGDVWLCSGQSNMAFGLDGCDPKDVAAADFPAIRCRGYFEHFAAAPQDDLATAVEWRALSPGTAGGCSAVGFYFARAVFRRTGVPIGLLECTVGGTEIECWMPPQAFTAYPENAPIERRLQEAIADYQQRLAAALPEAERWLLEAKGAAAAHATIPAPPVLPRHPNEDRERWVRTESLYNGMVHPLLRMAIRGVLWYQGENNGGEQGDYVAKFRAMVATWRQLWGRELPFYFVQLANWGKASDDPSGGGRDFQYCRMAQLQCLQIAHTGMAVAIDIGDADDIHPRNKQDVGERLARWALARDHGVEMQVSGPLYRSMQVDGGSVRVAFDHVGAGLMVGRKDGRAPVVEEAAAPLRRFAVAGADHVWHWAVARIDGETVVVSSEAVPAPVAVRYAFAGNPAGCNLYNRDGLPASPFRSDEW